MCTLRAFVVYFMSLPTRLLLPRRRVHSSRDSLATWASLPAAVLALAQVVLASLFKRFTVAVPEDQRVHMDVKIVSRPLQGRALVSLTRR